ncbi:MAG: Ribonuclease E [Alphaproteobacteria bacterium MarineAlpha6_Bin4]|nr:MAG: Ribonuclease E [Alphaproteobacteria bacterium MarineAlpha6_Bin3]PPR37683.1 MAG: Ribonuclease E [Alphaproteobacteria bacterium MarineAlpha6_Bin4]|tara:strand:+ start:5270 stop:7048 length:1779 start_codon:yes stop_codon:yes gene_type:complete
MEKRIIVDSSFAEETRVAFINGTEVEHFEVDTSSNKKQLKGNVYLAKVSRVEPSLQAAFVNYGGNKQGFLPFSEISNDYYKIPKADKKTKNDNEDFVVKDYYRDTAENKKSKFPKNKDFKKYKIQEVIKKNQIMLIQVVKDERGNKGAALTTFISIAGKYCVLMPNKSLGIKISKKISDFKERKKLTQIAGKCKLTKEMGLIIRTASRDCDENNLKKDFDYVLGIWKSIKEKTINSLAPTIINEDSNIVNKFIRDSFIEEYKEIVVEGENTYEKAKKYMKTLLPDQEKKIKIYKNTKLPIMEYFDLENKINSIYDKKVKLKSGGYIIINPTEALTAIDINSGQSTKERNVEETALKTNIEAVDEVCKQIRIRNIAGLVVVDFIDMEYVRNKIIIERRLKDMLRYDRAKCHISRISKFGLLELSRQRIGPSLEESTMEDGIISGIRCTIRSTSSSVAKILRKLKYTKLEKKVKELSVHLYETLYDYMNENNKDFLLDLEKKLKIKIILVKDNNIAPPYFIFKTMELNNKKKKHSVIYDDVPKIAIEEDAQEKREKKNTKKNNLKKEEDKKINTKKTTKVKKKETIEEVNSAIK